MWFHAACDALSCTPSTLLSLFDDYVEQYPADDQQDIFSLQDRFIRHQFTRADRSHLLPAMLSYMELHQGISYLQDTGENPEVSLYYPPDALARLDTLPVESFVDEYESFEEPITHLVFFQDDTLFVEAFDETRLEPGE